MTIQECYQEMGGNYAEVLTRLPTEKMVERFVLRFLEDHSFEQLCTSVAAGNREEAFRAAHTLKGVCANLSFTRLMGSADQLTELLRPKNDRIPEGAEALLATVRRDYQITVDAIHNYQAQK